MSPERLIKGEKHAERGHIHNRQCGAWIEHELRYSSEVPHDDERYSLRSFGPDYWTGHNCSRETEIFDLDKRRPPAYSLSRSPRKEGSTITVFRKIWLVLRMICEPGITILRDTTLIVVKHPTTNFEQHFEQYSFILDNIRICCELKSNSKFILSLNHPRCGNIHCCDVYHHHHRADRSVRILDGSSFRHGAYAVS